STSRLLLISRFPPSSIRIPYTTLFRSRTEIKVMRELFFKALRISPCKETTEKFPIFGILGIAPCSGSCLQSSSPSLFALQGEMRSEEHTSELQSPDHLVCRLLLEEVK